MRLVVGCALLSIFAGLACDAGGPSDPAAEAPQGSAGAAAERALQPRAEAGPAYRVHTEGVTLPFAKNPGQRFVASFAADRLRLHSSDVAQPYDLQLRLAAFGFGGALHPVDGSVRTAGAERVTYDRRNAAGGALREWFDNRADGVEHGFTVTLGEVGPDSAPATLQLQLDFAGDLRAAVTDAGQVALVGEDGVPRMHYDALHAFDADGVALPARFEQAGEAVAIVVDVRDARFPVTIDPLLWVFAQDLQAGGIGQDDAFGFSAAADGDVAVIGAPGADSDRGAVFVYLRNGDSWSETQRLEASDRASGDRFGEAVAVDGERVVVGAPDVGGSSAGKAYVFERNGTWSEDAILQSGEINDLLSPSRFGASVDVSGDTIAVGAPNRDCTNIFLTSCGHVYVFDTDGNSWSRSENWTQTRKRDTDYFGAAVALSGDTLVAGGPGRPGVYVFERSGATWSGGAQLLPGGVVVSDEFGGSVALTPLRLLVGAPGDNSRRGAAYLYERANAGDAFSLAESLFASDAAAGAQFGAAVAVEGDGLLVGAPTEPGDGSPADPGAVYAFDLDGSWQESKLLSSDPQQDELFGASVALSVDHALLGAPGDSDPATGSGRVQVQSRTSGLPLGDACADAGDCSSGFCVDGVCCESACGDGDPNDCQVCGAGGSCAARAADVECRAAAGVCDVAEACNGVDTACPADTFVQPGDALECRASSGGCDVAEYCDGSSGDCPADAVLPADVVCLAADPGAPCDLDDVCDGIGAACPTLVADAGTVCLAANGAPCDVDDVCDGVGTACPSLVAEQGTVCRAEEEAAGCDAAEVCDGASDACPDDQVKGFGALCRGPMDGFPCDAPEVCDGASRLCPAASLSAAPAGSVCREGDGMCDPDELCDGAATTCPDDVTVAAGSACEDDGDPCTTDLCGVAGCEHAAIDGCCASAADCDDGDACTTDSCADNVCGHAAVAGCTDNGGTGGSVGTGGTDNGGTGGSVGAGGAFGTGGSVGTGGALGAGGALAGTGGLEDFVSKKKDEGCGCRTIGGSRSTPVGVPLWGLGLLAVWMRRRRRRYSTSQK